MAKKTKLPKDASFSERFDALAIRLGIKPDDPAAYHRVAMKLIDCQPEFNRRGRPTGLNPSNTDLLIIATAQRVSNSLEITFNEALVKVVRMAEERGRALSKHGDPTTNLKRLRRIKKRMDSDRETADLIKAIKVVSDRRRRTVKPDTNSVH